jgi:hypothetical protein
VTFLGLHMPNFGLLHGPLPLVLAIKHARITIITV